ncbi:hypothetical protein [Pseudomonas nitroreducens]|uniref:hypothetical protein n=1 Tax=Pseudomonas nitroreducens TaxID=46680 RepID=UPI003CC83945
MATVQHIVTGNGAPADTPPSPGAHYIDLDYGDHYIAAGEDGGLYWVGPLAIGRLEPNGSEPTVGPDHIGQRIMTSALLFFGVSTDGLGGWRKFPAVLAPLNDTDDDTFANNASPLAQVVYWTPASNSAPHVLEAPGWTASAHINMRFLLTLPDVSQPLRLTGMSPLYCNVASAAASGSADVTLTAPVNLVHVVHAPGGAWMVTVEPVQAPA